MPGEDDLSALLRNLDPILCSELYTFAKTSERTTAFPENAFALIRETEGATIVCKLDDALSESLPHDGRFRKITLNVHSSLAAVGLTAAVSSSLAKRGIPCNVIAGFHHDHLFIPEGQAEEALLVLSTLRFDTP